MTLQNLSYLAAIIAMVEPTITDLKDGYIRVETKKYTVEVPKGWEVGEESSFGQREFHSSKGEIGTMTGSAKGSNWDRLYNTSLYFIQRREKATPTPYKLGKNKKGYETMSFEMMGKDGKPTSKYVILKNAKEDILALSVRITQVKSETELNKAFDRLISTAVMNPGPRREPSPRRLPSTSKPLRSIESPQARTQTRSRKESPA